MADQKLVRLIEQLYNRTLEGIVRWEKTASAGMFQTSFPYHSIVIFQRPSRNQFLGDELDYVIQIFNNEGITIEEVSNVDFDTDQLTPMPFRMMQEIYSIARRNALGADKEIDALLMELSNKAA